MSAPEIFTVGHSTHSAEELVALLARHGVEALADVRRYPGSRRNPQFNAEALAESLAAAGVGYHRFGEALGGRRRARRDSPHGGWRVEGFRAYADHTETEEFRRGLAALEELARKRRTAVMCAEGDWHRCHRRLIADALAARGWSVLHIGPDGTLSAHELPDFARVRDRRVSYPPPQGSLEV